MVILPLALFFGIEMKYYVYVHKRNDTGKVFYVGKGTGNRFKNKRGRNAHWERIVEKHGFTAEIIKSGLSSDQAMVEEIALIKKIGRENLCNKTDGGEGTPGRVVKESTRKKMSIMFKGIPPSEEAISASIEKNSKRVGTVCGLRFSSCSEAVRYLISIGHKKASLQSVGASLKGTAKLAYGFEFRYLDHEGNLLPSNYVDRRKREIETDMGEIFRTTGEAAIFLINSGIAKTKNPSIVARNIYSAMHGKRGSIFAYGRKWKFKDEAYEFREKKSRKGFEVVCGNGIRFMSIADAARYIKGGKNKNSNINLKIKQCCDGLIESAYGNKWSYINNGT